MLCLSGFELYSRWVPLLPYVPLKRSTDGEREGEGTGRVR